MVKYSCQAKVTIIKIKRQTMTEPFKNELGELRINIIANHLSSNDSDFNQSQFLQLALNNLDALSLMERNRQIVDAMYQCLPRDFLQAKNILINSLAPTNNQTDAQGIHSWLAVPLAEYLGKYGTDHLPEAMNGLASVTQLFSSEFGIRHLLDRHQETSLKQLHEWCEHDNEHVRRLVSEGSRPRLPWGFQLKAFVESPDLTFPLLEKLKNDSSDYVRLSVSNHLNDISKDHPDYLQEKLQDWMELENPQRMRLIKHACRTLIKQGHQPTLSMLGYDPLKLNNVSLDLQCSVVQYGEALSFDVSFDGPKGKDIIVDYAIHFQKANGSTSPKVFKWKVGKINNKGQLNAKKNHTIKPITTRKYYNGDHQLEILVNGQSIALMPFILAGVT
jgi:3-methyladenine DNA glycosylase AlkC